MELGLARLVKIQLVNLVEGNIDTDFERLVEFLDGHVSEWLCFELLPLANALIQGLADVSGQGAELSKLRHTSFIAIAIA
jgi:hypothetical protein